MLCLLSLLLLSRLVDCKSVVAFKKQYFVAAAGSSGFHPCQGQRCTEGVMHAAADTPGIHFHHRLPHLLSPEELKQLHPRRRLRPYYPPPPRDLMQEEDVGMARSRGNANE